MRTETKGGVVIPEYELDIGRHASGNKGVAQFFYTSDRTEVWI